jgi:hypothetical protein
LIAFAKQNRIPDIKSIRGQSTSDFSTVKYLVIYNYMHHILFDANQLLFPPGFANAPPPNLLRHFSTTGLSRPARMAFKFLSRNASTSSAPTKRRRTKLKILPNASAMTVLVSMMTLYGILKSGVGSERSSEVVLRDTGVDDDVICITAGLRGY